MILQRAIFKQDLCDLAHVSMNNEQEIPSNTSDESSLYSASVLYAIGKR